MIDDISHKTLISAKPLHVRFNKVDGFIRVYDGTRYLVLFGAEKYDSIYNRIRYLIGIKNGITHVFFCYYAKIKVDSYNSVPLEKTLTLHNVIIHITSFLNKDQNHYFYKIFSEKFSCQFAKK